MRIYFQSIRFTVAELFVSILKSNLSDRLMNLGTNAICGIFTMSYI